MSIYGAPCLAQCVDSSHTYFAERLHQNLKGGLGTHEDIVIRIVVSHCEVSDITIV